MRPVRSPLTRLALLLSSFALLAACGAAPSPTALPSDPGTPTAGGPRPGVAGNAAELRALPNGLIVALLPHRQGEPSQLQLGLLAGSDFVSPGLAELAAAVLVDSADAARQRPSLRSSVEQLGGTLSIEVNPLSTWITIRAPESAWRRIQVALAAALGETTVSRSQIERVRDELVVDRIRAVWQQAEREVPRAFLLGYRGTAPYIASLLERDASEISLFAARLYRPETTVLSVRAPGQPNAILAELGKGIAGWPAPTAARTQVAIEARRLESGLYWAPTPGTPRCRAMLVLPLPDLANPIAPELFVMHACVTLDGIGGRLETMLQEGGLGPVAWRTEVIDLADVPAVVLTTEIDPALAPRLWNVAQAARQSLLDVPPTPSELELALRRARLTAQLLIGNLAARSRVQTAAATRRQPDDALEQRFDRLAEAGKLNAAGAAHAYLTQPAAMIVLGGEIPAGAPARTFELLPPGALARLVSPDPVAQSAAAGPWLTRAIEVAGGRTLLTRFAGFDCAATLSSEGAPQATEDLAWREPERRIDRTRKVLGTEIVTSIAAASATEKCAGKEVTLPPREAGILRRELRRHPIALLAAVARGELRFRPVAQRAVGDRDLMILEAVGDRFDRLRIHLDTVSYLIRVVEVWETSTDGATFHVRDAWSDYRNAAAIRAPFRRVTELDDGRNRVETVYTQWRPELLPE
ncbi:MAG: hypothetical protein KDE27_07785 [Planctomycetes bacterium]|nr:hypothetical protein [Planctomycetota bacterium]